MPTALSADSLCPPPRSNSTPVDPTFAEARKCACPGSCRTIPPEIPLAAPTRTSALQAQRPTLRWKPVTIPPPSPGV